MENRYYDLVLLDSGISAVSTIKKKGYLNSVPGKYHGSASFLTITGEYQRNLSTLAIDVTDDRERSSSTILAKALEQLLAIDLNIICVPLATTKNTVAMQRVCQELSRQGKKIIAAAGNNWVTLKSYPAEYSDVIGINGQFYETNRDYSFDSSKSLQGSFNSAPTFFKLENKKFYFYAGNSKACSLAAAKYLQNSDPSENVNRNLMKNTVSDSKPSNEFLDIYGIKEEVCHIFSEVFSVTSFEKISSLEKCSIIDFGFKFNREQISNYLLALINKFPFLDREYKFEWNDIESVAKVVQFIMERKASDEIGL